MFFKKFLYAARWSWIFKKRFYFQYHFRRLDAKKHGELLTFMSLHQKRSFLLCTLLVKVMISLRICIVLLGLFASVYVIVVYLMMHFNYVKYLTRLGGYEGTFWPSLSQTVSNGEFGWVILLGETRIYLSSAVQSIVVLKKIFTL